MKDVGYSDVNLQAVNNSEIMLAVLCSGDCVYTELCPVSAITLLVYALNPLKTYLHAIRLELTDI